MRQEQVFEMISGLVDNELSPDKRFQILNHLEQDKQSQEDYNKLKALKTNLSETLPKDQPSDNFEAMLKQKIANEYQSKPNWFENIMNWDYKLGNKLSYGMVTASILFIGFIGVKYLGPDAIDSNYLATHTTSSPKVENTLQINNTTAIPTRVIATTPIIDSKNGNLKVYNREGKSISIPLTKENPLKHIDRSSSKDFNDVLAHMEYFRGLYYREIGDHKKSKECLSSYLKIFPENNSKITHIINEQSDLNRVSPGSNEK